MSKLDKGKLFLRCAAHALFVGLKEIPGIGMAVEMGQGWFDIFRDEQRKAGFGERLEQLEQAGAILPGEARTIANNFISEQRTQGIVVEEEQAEAIRDLLMFMPATIKERTQATLQQARQHGTNLQTVLPITDETDSFDQEEFYRSLFPARRPRFQTNDPVPHGLAGWQLGELLGTGGFGEVWEVRHERLRYAIKFFLGEINEKILSNEAEMLFDVHEKLPRHTNIVHLTSMNLKQSPYWLLFEFVEGGTLESLLRATPLSWQESLSLFRQIVAGVGAVHQIGIVHRDLKPANILLTADGTPKITDFGIGKVLAEKELLTRTQYTTQGFGSVGYMSPEQRRGKKAHSSDDTYALGVLLWQMLVQTLDIPEFDWEKKLQQQNVPKALQNAVSVCLTKSRQQRPANAMALLEMLPTKAGDGLQDELMALNKQLADLQTQEAEAIESNEAAKQRDLARQKLAKAQEVEAKQRQVKAESARQKVYDESLQEAKLEQAEINVRAEERLAEMRKLVEHKRQRGGDAPLQLQAAMEELQQVEALINKIETDYAKEQAAQQQKIKQALQEALAKLVKLKSAPKDRFERTVDYEQRLKREKAEYAAQQEKIKASWQQEQEKLDKQLQKARLQDLAVLQQQRDILLNKQFDVPPAQLKLELLDYNADEELLAFNLIAEEVMPNVNYAIENASLSIEPKEAKICWSNWEQALLIPYLVFGLDNGAKAIKAGFETADKQYFVTRQKLKQLEEEKKKRLEEEKKKQLEEEKKKQLEEEKKKRLEEEKKKQAEQLKNQHFVKLDNRGQILPNSASKWFCVKDNKTGLIWEVKSDDKNNLHYKGDEYTWYDSKSRFLKIFRNKGYPDVSGCRGCYGYQAGKPETYCNTQAYVARVNAENYCGFNDWRMPTKKELLSIVDKSRKKPAIINTDYFPETKSGWYWSGSPLAGNPNEAWYVYFSNGDDDGDDRNSYRHVRLVRGGQ